MSQPEAKSNEPSKMKKLLNGDDSDESPLARLPRGAADALPKNIEKPASPPTQEHPK